MPAQDATSAAMIAATNRKQQLFMLGNSPDTTAPAVVTGVARHRAISRRSSHKSLGERRTRIDRLSAPSTMPSAPCGFNRPDFTSSPTPLPDP
jgi:hypothetical protein